MHKPRYRKQDNQLARALNWLAKRFQITDYKQLSNQMITKVTDYKLDVMECNTQSGSQTAG